MDFENAFMQGLSDGIEKNAKFKLPLFKKAPPKKGAVAGMMEKVKGAAGKAKEVAKDKGPAAAAGAAGGGILGALLARRGKKEKK